MRLGRVEGFLLSRRMAVRVAGLGGQQDHRPGGLLGSGEQGLGLRLSTRLELLVVLVQGTRAQARWPGRSGAPRWPLGAWSAPRPPATQGQTEDGICKLLGLRTALLTAQANPRAQVRAS